MTTPHDIQRLVDGVTSRHPLGGDVEPRAFVHVASAAGPTHYGNVNERLAIDFRVERLTFPCMQTMDPRLVRIAPASNNEYHRHAHESLFVVLEGEGEVLVGTVWTKVQKGDVAFVPRWIFHQTRNTSTEVELVILAITDFGFTSAVLGDYDKRTRLAAGGDDVIAGSPAGASAAR